MTPVAVANIERKCIFHPRVVLCGLIYTVGNDARGGLKMVHRVKVGLHRTSFCCDDHIIGHCGLTEIPFGFILYYHNGYHQPDSQSYGKDGEQSAQGALQQIFQGNADRGHDGVSTGLKVILSMRRE